MASFQRFLFITVLLFSSLAFGGKGFREFWIDPKLSDKQRIQFFLKVKSFYLENAELFAQEEILTTGWNLLDLAYADEDLDCFYGGFPSKRVRSGGRLLCNRPHGLNPSYTTLASRYNCEGKNKYLCNPALFGLGSGEGLCLPLRTRQDINNITANCEASFQAALRSSGKSVENYLLKQLRNHEEPFHSQWLQTLESLERQSHCPTKYSWCRIVRQKVSEFKTQLAADLASDETEDASVSDDEIPVTDGGATVPSLTPSTPSPVPPASAPASGGIASRPTDGNVGLGDLTFTYVNSEAPTNTRSLEGYPGLISTKLNDAFRIYGADAYGPTYFGYGFLHPDSEFAAKTVAQFDCAETNLSANAQALCQDLTASTGTNVTTELLLPVIQPIFLQKLQQKTYELQAVSLKAGGKSLGEKPACVEAADYDKLKQLPARHPVDTYELFGQLRGKDLARSDKELLNKFGAAGYGMDLERILRDVMVSKNLEDILAKQTTHSPYKESQLERLTFLKNSSGPLRQATPAQISAIMSDVYNLLGDTPAQGEALFNDSNLTLSHSGQSFNERLAQRLFARPELKRALTEKLRGLRDSYLSGLTAGAASLCDQSAEELITKYPNAVRQLLIDDPEAKSLHQYLLCQSSAFKASIQTSKTARERQTCAVVGDHLRPYTGGTSITPLPGLEIKVPTVAESPIDVHLEIPIKVAPKSFGSEDINSPRFKTLLSQWANKLNEYYNEQSTNFSSIHPGESLPRHVRFTFTFKPVTSDAEGATQIYECFEPGLGSNCQEIILTQYQRCVARPTHDASRRQTECTEKRDRYLADIRAGRYDRLPRKWNSMSFTPDIPARTLAHEVGHKMGLFDEYQSGMFDSIANDKSLMGQGNNLSRRHFEQMVFDHVNCLR